MAERLRHPSGKYFGVRHEPQPSRDSTHRRNLLLSYDELNKRFDPPAPVQHEGEMTDGNIGESPALRKSHVPDVFA
jgi:hypothetical protein